MDAPNPDPIEAHFHALIHHRAGHLLAKHPVPLPRLADLPADDPRDWFPVPGMYGGFAYRFEDAARRDTLIVESGEALNPSPWVAR